MTDDAIVERIAGPADAGLLILCDHAGNAVPEALAGLGLPADELSRHIAFDIGAAGVVRALARRLGCPALLTRVSRLVVDCNRGADDPTLIMEISDGALVPGNIGLSPEARAERIAQFHTPYRAAIAAQLAVMAATGRVPAVMSVHSFTPAWRGAARPWEVAVLWDRDPRLALPLLAALRGLPGLTVGENVPYSGGLAGDTLYSCATAEGFADAMIELRQDEIADTAGQEAWARRLAETLAPLLAAAGALGFDRRQRHGSRADGDTVAPLPEALQAAVFRRLVAHLAARPDVQNIDLMNLADFCRNCLGNWLAEASAETAAPLSREDARTHIYGMPYATWKALHQREAAPAAQVAFAQREKRE